MSYKLLKDWADVYEPLERQTELDIIEKSTDDADLLEIMLKHNARMLVKEIGKWRNTYDLDDASSIVILKLTRNFDKWDKKSSFYYFANLRIKSALHENTRKSDICTTMDDITHFDEILASEDITEYDDVLEYCEEILSKDEYEMIRSIYKDGKMIKDSSNIASTSRKHHKILEKLAKLLENPYE